MDGMLRLLHPIIPFVSEALLAADPAGGGREESLSLARWPSRVQVDGPEAEE